VEILPFRRLVKETDNGVFIGRRGHNTVLTRGVTLDRWYKSRE
jgi:hypothetical protein